MTSSFPSKVQSSSSTSGIRMMTALMLLLIICIICIDTATATAATAATASTPIKRRKLSSSTSSCLLCQSNTTTATTGATTTTSNDNSTNTKHQLLNPLYYISDLNSTCMDMETQLKNDPLSLSHLHHTNTNVTNVIEEELFCANTRLILLNYCHCGIIVVEPPTSTPTSMPTQEPSISGKITTTMTPSMTPSLQLSQSNHPTSSTSSTSSNSPTLTPSFLTFPPSSKPSSLQVVPPPSPTSTSTSFPSIPPTTTPTVVSLLPSSRPSYNPSGIVTTSIKPSSKPSLDPSISPSSYPSLTPSSNSGGSGSTTAVNCTLVLQREPIQNNDLIIHMNINNNNNPQWKKLSTEVMFDLQWIKPPQQEQHRDYDNEKENEEYAKEYNDHSLEYEMERILEKFIYLLRMFVSLQATSTSIATDIDIGTGTEGSSSLYSSSPCSAKFQNITSTTTIATTPSGRYLRTKNDQNQNHHHHPHHRKIQTIPGQTIYSIPELYEQYGIHIHLVNFINMTFLTKEKCKDSLRHSGGGKKRKCQVVKGAVDIYYIITTTDNTNNEILQELELEEDIQRTVMNLIQNEFHHIAAQFPSIHTIEFHTPKSKKDDKKKKDDEKNVPNTIYNEDDMSSSSTKMTLIGVAVATSVFILIAMLLMTRGRKQQQQHQRRNPNHINTSIMGIEQPSSPHQYNQRHHHNNMNMIRSDDSISDSPTMSSIHYERGLDPCRSNNNNNNNRTINAANSINNSSRRRRRTSQRIVSAPSDESIVSAPSASSSSSSYSASISGSDVMSSSDVTSTTSSSRPSFNVQLEEASHGSQGISKGIEATRQGFYINPATGTTSTAVGGASGMPVATYLPNSVLKDLLDGNGRTKSFGVLDAAMDL